MEHPNYSEETFWDKVEAVAKRAKEVIKDVLQKALVLYYAALDEETPEWARVVAFSAMAYFVMPIDVIPDYIPAIGYSDDLAILAGAIVTIAMHIKLIHRKQADEKMDELFGEIDEDEDDKIDSDDDNPPQLPVSNP